MNEQGPSDPPRSPPVRRGFVPPPVQPVLRGPVKRRPWVVRKWSAFREDWTPIGQALSVIGLASLYLMYRVGRVWLVFLLLHRR